MSAKSTFIVFSDTLDAVKQSAALCLLRLIRNAPESVSMSEWSSRVIHLLNDQHMVRQWVTLSFAKTKVKKP